jgi:hypothetical protein
MPVPRATSLTIVYTAWDYPNNQGKTGDAGNHTLRLVRDGSVVAPTSIPVEVDIINAPGQYRLNLSSSEMDATFIVITGKSSSAGVSIIPVNLVTT